MNKVGFSSGNSAMALGFRTFISPSVSGRPTQVGVVLWRGSIGAAGAWHLSLPLPHTLLIAPASKLTPVAISGHYGFPCFDFIPSRLPPGPTAPIALSSTPCRLNHVQRFTRGVLLSRFPTSCSPWPFGTPSVGMTLKRWPILMKFANPLTKTANNIFFDLNCVINGSIWNGQLRNSVDKNKSVCARPSDNQGLFLGWLNVV